MQVSRSSGIPSAVGVVKTYKFLLILVWNPATFRCAGGSIAPPVILNIAQNLINF